MVVYGTQARATQRRRALNADGLPYYKAEWMESGDDPLLSPTVFLIEQPPNSTLAPHFHRQNQFQLFVAGGGRIGSAALEAVTVHYAGAYTGYGPLVAGDQGIQYFTIRPVFEAGALYISQARDQMKRGPKRHATSAPLQPLAPAELAALAAPVVVEAIPVGEDGMGVQLLRLPPGQVVNLPFPAAAQGAFAVVLAGGIVHGGQTLGRLESVYASTGDEMSPLQAGPEGAELVLLFTPAKASAYL